MIAVTTNSLNRNSTLPPLPNAVECAFLERVTGADFLISIAPYPIRTEALLIKHIDAGAILIQHKSGLDMCASLGERLDSEIARMTSVALRQWQCVLLATGIYARKGKALTLNGIDTGITWAQYDGAVEAWGERGGLYRTLPSDADIPEWCERKLKHLADMKDNPVKRVYSKLRMQADPPLDVPSDHPEYDPLQLCININDWRNLAVNVPGQGPTIAEWLYRVTDGNWGFAMTLMTHPEYYKQFDDRPKNFGAAQIEKNRLHFGIAHPNYITQIEYDVEGEKSDE